jgi:hypothetical protein
MDHDHLIGQLHTAPVSRRAERLRSPSGRHFHARCVLEVVDESTTGGTTTHLKDELPGEIKPTERPDRIGRASRPNLNPVPHLRGRRQGPRRF